MKHKKLIRALIALITVVLFLLYLIFLSANEKYNSIPYILGSLAVFASFAVKNSGRKAEEWNGNEQNDIEADK